MGNQLQNSQASERRRVVVLVRWVVIATSAYILVANSGYVWNNPKQVTIIGLFALSNVLLSLLSPRFFVAPQFGPALLLADSLFIVLGLSSHYGFSQDILVFYFFTIFLISIGDSLASIATGSGVISALYAYWLWHHNQRELSEAWLRIPFFFLVAIFYGSLTEQLKAERHRRESAEQESRHLRLLLELAGTF